MPPTRHNKTPDKQKRWILVAAARPNFMKIAPLMRAIAASNLYNANSIKPFLVHTGQHYDDNMSDSFFRELQIPKPDVHLGVGSGTHAQQTGNVMIAFEQVLLSEKPDLVIVVGDVNSTLACALTAVKLHIPVAHVEAGLRSFDRKMPEEINRILTDALSDYLFTPSPDGDDNLLREGVAREKIFLVGDIMVDSLLFNLEKAKKTDILEGLGLQSADKKKGRAGIQPYAMLTLHRPSNVDDPKTFKRILSGLSKVASKIPLIFPIHPRTRKQITAFGLKDAFVFHSSTDILHENHDEKVSNEGRIHCFDPMGYLDFLNLMAHAKMVFTDSGGIQEETTVLNIPCITLRDTTERPITLTDGTNVLAGDDPEKIIMEADNVLDGKAKKGRPIEIWDGRTAERIVEILSKSI
ncbi:MAG TPA: UDP-N-acetylglucosamine 2-epimerase (non-hydrolyzing) [Desulfobacteraceae bacterium]|nr:UDP-N-acetylglucosamine 2-epimerase (non-hydrolyzing) [Desulfobacteraceae bacterium]HPJ66204.1 UDP-N-acetylglucosamine 2-epimerase (non-hydrolyzing) [Desulfobacteraceae bacterium]HPQ29039.1 UDP-N-acetylglucosamine 2-epimerase (non-hydrolyzing) [Desulfobacteraceae bacterium]